MKKVFMLSECSLLNGQKVRKKVKMKSESK